MMTIPIPEQMRHLPLDSRGLPIPYVVLMDNSGCPHFKVNDIERSLKCVQQRLCHVCGKKLNKEFWFIGGQLSAFHPKGVFVEGGAHKECGIYSLQVCPYLVNNNYKGAVGFDKLMKIADKLEGKVTGLIDATQTADRLLLFIFAKAKDYEINYNPPGFSVRPRRPYEQIEFWSEGRRIHKAEAKEILKNNGEKIYIP